MIHNIDVFPQQNLQKVFDDAPQNAVITLHNGEYKGKFEITKSVRIVGEDGVIITNDDYANKLDEKGVMYNTFRTYTVAVLTDNVTIQNVTIVNSAKSPEVKGQEVALSAIGDNFVAENCTFVSTQDTLFCGPLPYDLVERYDGFLKDSLRVFKPMKQYYVNCTIYGTVDFIFGCADALFDSCNIVSLNDKRGGGFVSAPAHSNSQQIGFVFNKCNFDKESDVLDNVIYLARPWRDYGKSSFISCTYGSHIIDCGFDKWNDTERDKTARFGEYGNIPRGRVSWSKTLSETEAQTLLNYFK